MATPPNQRINTLEQENAELRRQLDQAHAQQTATAEVLQVINGSPGDLKPVFDAILEKAMSLCEAALGFMTTYDGERFVPTAMRDVPDALAAYFAKGMDQPQPGEAHWRLLHGEDLVHNLDQKDEDAYRSGSPLRHAVVDLGGTRTALVVALRGDRALLGTLTLYRTEVRAFTDRQITLVQNFAAQAVIAMENARLITETHEALDQQTATAEVLGVINASPGDLAPVFDAMLDKAMRLCEAAFGILFTLDGESIVAGALRNVPAAFGEYLAREPPRVGTGTLLGRTIVERVPLQTADILSSEPYLQGASLSVASAELAHIRTLLVVPLVKDDAVLGLFTVYRTEVRPFTDKQIALLLNFAAQAVIAMENARLITETQEALDQQTATAEVLGVINSSPGDLAPVFRAMLDRAMRLCEAAYGLMWVADGDVFDIAAWVGVPDAFVRGLPKRFAPAPKGPLGQLLTGEPFVHIDDLRDAVDAMPGAQVSLRGAEAGARTLLAVPLSQGGRVLGVFVIFRREVRAFTDKQIAFLQNFAGQAVIAMENARLLGELRQRTDEVAELNRGLEARVAEQVDELGRVRNLTRFLPPQVAEMVVSQGNERILESHRREIVVVFCDVRGYTAFSETAEPEEVIEFLSEYHAALGPLITRFEGTLSHFLGDGLMVFFNDPVPCPDPAERAVKMAVAMREAAGDLVAAWRRRGHQMGFGAGVAQGYATLGQIGFADRSDYTAIGTVCNLAARLCGEAQDGQILLARRVAIAVEDGFVLEELGSLTLKGLTQPVVAFNVVGTADLAAAASD